MFYDPSTQTEFASIDAFRLAHKDTSFGDLYTEAGRNEAGLFTIIDLQPDFDPLVNSLVPGGVELVGSSYCRQYTLGPSEIDTNTVRATLWDRIKAIRDRKTQQGGYKVGGDWFHSDTFSRTQQIGLTIMGAAMPAGIMWKTMSGTFVEMTPTLAQQIFAAAGVQDALLFAHAEQLKAQVEASDDPASVEINVGWPETYNGI